MHLKFENVTGYSSYANAEKRGKEVAGFVDMKGATGHGDLRWLVIALPTGRFAPAFYCGNVPGGPGQFLNLTNVCCFN